MTMQSRHYLLSSCIIVLITMLMCNETYSQDGIVVHQLKSFSEFSSEIDTLKTYQVNDRLSEYDYLIRYIEIKKVHGKTEKYGSIFIKGDSIITYYHSKPSIVGDPFSANPVISDSASIGIFKNKIEKKRSGWIKRLEHLNGFYSQNTKLGSKEFYPHNWIQCLMIFNKSGICFGLISYGSHDVDYQIVGKSESDSLKELIDFVF